MTFARSFGIRARILGGALVATIAAVCLLAAAGTAQAAPSQQYVYYKNTCGGKTSLNTVTLDKNQGPAQLEILLVRHETPVADPYEAIESCEYGDPGTIPAPDVPIEWEVTSGPCAGKSGTGFTDADGRFVISLEGCDCGSDQVKIRIKKELIRLPVDETIPATSECVFWLAFFCIIDAPGSLDATVVDSYWMELDPAFVVNWTGCVPPPPNPPDSGTNAQGALAVSARLANSSCKKSRVTLTVLVSSATVTGTTIYVDGRKVRSSVKKAAKGSATTQLTYSLNTKGMKAGLHSIKMTIRYSNGTTSTVTRRFRACSRATAKVSPRFTG